MPPLADSGFGLGMIYFQDGDKFISDVYNVKLVSIQIGPILGKCCQKEIILYSLVQPKTS